MSAKAFNQIADGLQEALAVARGDMKPHQQKGPAEAATSPSRGSSRPQTGNAMNAKTHNTAPALPTTTPHHIRALRIIADAHSLVHAAWMAAGALDRGDHAAEQDAIRSVLHLAGESLDDAANSLRKIEVAA